MIEEAKRVEFGSLINAVETYLRLRGEAESCRSTEPCLDWDCDLATDLEGQTTGGVNADLAQWKRNLEDAINRYIDMRVRTALEEYIRNPSHLRAIGQRANDA